ncbi:hypothetical protein Pcinc_028627 [Petrolisthes cinctipes]|uniref:G-protein coupled receptors family 1 profile domain-containing protein n=1 Tax=Petrolisthes cinctipes TaxID=88211 RepID=A0AAE1K6Z5_PETCI|nr:hypothetical protein Pcinc_028627 [Petrolisthes cinctipes]
MLATVTVFFFVSLFPFRVLTLWIVWTPKDVIETMGALRFFSLLYGARVLFFANSAVNPILYNLTSTKFREAFLKLLSRDAGRRHLSRQSTFNTTGTSMSNGRSGSSRTVPTDVAGIREGLSARMALARCGRHASFDDVPLPRPSIARYGRQSSFAGSYCFPSNVANSNNNSAACSRQNSRAGENGVVAPIEGLKRGTEGEKPHSGEGRRLLERDRSTSLTTNMIEEERSSCSTGGGRQASVKSNQARTEAETEKLLSDSERMDSPKNTQTFSHNEDTDKEIKPHDTDTCDRQNLATNDLDIEAESVATTELCADNDPSVVPLTDNTSREEVAVVAFKENGKSVQFTNTSRTKSF